MTKSALLDKIYADEFLNAYIEAALWSSTTMEDQVINDEEVPEGTSLDDAYFFDDIQYASLKYLVDYAEDWLYSDDVQMALASLGDYDEGQLGHDLWLTAAGHGAGFWDGDWPEPEASVLDETSRAYGAELYDANGKVYVFGGENYKG